MIYNFLIDDREHNQVLKDTFLELSIQKMFDFTISHLDIGDVQCGNIVIERKEASDFIGSIMDKRLSNQAKKMNMGGFDYKFIIIEGNPYQTLSQISNKAIIGAMTSILIKYDIKIMWVSNVIDFAYACYSIVDKIAKGDAYDGNYTPIEPPKAENEDFLAYMLSTIPNVSFDKAQMISALYDNSLYNFVNNATPGRIATINGIGKTISKKIYEAIRK